MGGTTRQNFTSQSKKSTITRQAHRICVRYIVPQKTHFGKMASQIESPCIISTVTPPGHPKAHPLGSPAPFPPRPSKLSLQPSGSSWVKQARPTPSRHDGKQAGSSPRGGQRRKGEYPRTILGILNTICCASTLYELNHNSSKRDSVQVVESEDFRLAGESTNRPHVRMSNWVPHSSGAIVTA